MLRGSQVTPNQDAFTAQGSLAAIGTLFPVYATDHRRIHSRPFMAVNSVSNASTSLGKVVISMLADSAAAPAVMHSKCATITGIRAFISAETVFHKRFNGIYQDDFCQRRRRILTTRARGTVRTHRDRNAINLGLYPSAQHQTTLNTAIYMEKFQRLDAFLVFTHERRHPNGMRRGQVVVATFSGQCGEIHTNKPLKSNTFTALHQKSGKLER